MIRERWKALPLLIRFMLSQFADGVAIGLVFALALIHWNVMGLGTLFAGPVTLALGLYLGQSALLFGTVSTSVGVMNLTEDD